MELQGHIFDALREPLLILSADQRVVLANAAFYRTFRVSPSETLGRYIYDLGNGQWSIPALRRLLEALLPAHNTIEAFEVEHHFPGVGQRIMLLNARRLQPSDQAEENILLAIEDVTALRRAEHALQLHNRDLESLIHVASHDLREPLRAMENFGLLLEQRHAESLDETGRDYLRRIVRASRRMRRLTDDLLTLSKARRLETEYQASVPLGEAAADALQRCEEQIRGSRATVRVSPHLPAINGDREWLIIALTNLISNAVKFACKDAPPEVDILPYDEEGRRGCIVADRGPGVAPEHAEMIFEPFKRAVGREVEGTGAGLAIVSAVVARHGGSAWVRPRQGGGSEFVLAFP